MDYGYFRFLEDTNTHVDRFRREADAYRLARAAKRRRRARRHGV